MNAAVRTGKGITFESNVPLPKVKNGQVMIRVKAAAINPVDYKLPKWLIGPVAGIDVAGVVESVAPDVTRYKPGRTAHMQHQKSRASTRLSHRHSPPMSLSV